MTTPLRLLIVLAATSFPASLVAAQPLSVEAPEGRLKVNFRLDARGRPVFDVAYRDKVIASGKLIPVPV